MHTDTDTANATTVRFASIDDDAVASACGAGTS